MALSALLAALEKEGVLLSYCRLSTAVGVCCLGTAECRQCVGDGLVKGVLKELHGKLIAIELPSGRRELQVNAWLRAAGNSGDH